MSNKPKLTLVGKEDPLKFKGNPDVPTQKEFIDNAMEQLQSLKEKVDTEEIDINVFQDSMAQVILMYSGTLMLCAVQPTVQFSGKNQALNSETLVTITQKAL